MEKAAITRFRNLAKAATVTLYSKDLNSSGTHDVVTLPAELHVVCDNSLNFIDDNNGSAIWDDTNEVVYVFTYNTDGTYYTGTTNTISNGDQPAIPLCLICIDYGEIQNIRMQLNMEQFQHVATQLSLTPSQIEYYIKKFWDGTNQVKIIKKKRETSYSTNTSKSGSSAKVHYDDKDEYNRTIHPVAY